MFSSPGGAVPQVSVRAVRAPRVRPDAGQPHLHLVAVPARAQGLRQAQEEGGIHRAGMQSIVDLVII